MSIHPVRYSGQLLLRELQKMRRRAVRLKRSIILILLVDEEAARFSAMAVYLIHDTARLLTGLLRQPGKQRSNLRFVSRSCHPGYRQNNHCLSAAEFVPARYFSTSANSSTKIVSSRPG